MSDPKRHHYLPQFHLRRFGFGDGNGLIYRFDKTDGSIARTTVKGSAFEVNYYTLTTPDGSRDTGLEAALSRVESNAAPAIARLLELTPGRQAISEDDRVAIALYLALLHGRVPGARNPAEEMTDVLGKMIIDMNLSIPDAYRQVALANGAHDEPGALEAERLQLLADLRAGKWKISPPEGWSTLVPLQIAINDVGPILTGMRWHLARRTVGPYLVIGDNPVAPSRTAAHDPRQGVGIGTPGVEVLVPLAADTILILADVEHDGLIDVLPPVGSKTAGDPGRDWAMLMNREQWHHAERYVFSRQAEDLDAVRSGMGEDRARRAPTMTVRGGDPAWSAYATPRTRFGSQGPANREEPTTGPRRRRPRRAPSWKRRRR